ncbi:molybdopterin-dependent oxidoreductase [Sagittula sp. S175]|uniref:molybdopterin-dependent oxidoreductase n=1 Tax=Sagittula sp. S175 TaxID=3415129 RepID=UPI003C7B6AC1
MATPLHAQELGTPEGDVLLTISGEINQTNVGDTAQFDRAMLEDLGLRKIVTHTIWTEGPQTFEGVPLKTLADLLGIEGGMISAVAVNDYAVEIPFADVTEDAAILAIKRNGNPMSVRDKGPIWLIYPYDSDLRYRSETYHARSIWQLVRLVVAP